MGQCRVAWRPLGSLHTHHLFVAETLEAPQHLTPVQVVAGPLRRLDVEIKATLCENPVVVLFVAQSGLEACQFPPQGEGTCTLLLGYC